MDTQTSASLLPNVLCIIVTFNPDVASLKGTVNALLSQVQKILVIDNKSDEPLTGCIVALAAHEQVEVIRCNDNIGLAAAQNLGITHAQVRGFEYVLLLDQDSHPDSSFTQQLIQAFSKGPLELIGAVGPTIVDRRSSREALLARTNTKIPFMIEKDFIISSGTLIKTSVLGCVGGMNESLFIDHVDHDWCLRARALNYGIYQTSEATLFHALGDQVIRLWLFRWRNFSVHSPLRNYYKVRNAFFLSKQCYVPTYWKHFFLKQSLMVALLSMVIASRRLQRLRYLALGIYHGLTDRLGKFRG